MRMRSTGLGKTELVAELSDLEREGDYLVLSMKVIEPTKWRVKAGLSFGDLMKILGYMFKPTNLAYLVVGFFKYRNPDTHLEL
jgi:hypothetical protein